MKLLIIAIFALLLLTACSTTKYQIAPELCPEAPTIVVPEPPTAVTSEPIARDFLKRFHEHFGASK